jgi:hypothetical protein
MGRGVVDGRDYHALNFDAGFHLWSIVDAIVAIGTARFGTLTVGLLSDAAHVLDVLLERLPGFNRKRLSY